MLERVLDPSCFVTISQDVVREHLMACAGWHEVIATMVTKARNPRRNFDCENGRFFICYLHAARWGDIARRL